MSHTNAIYYPQDEMTTFMLPITLGCSYNKCVFCSMYKDIPYLEIPLSEIKHHLVNADQYTDRVFLTGSDPLSVGFAHLKKILDLIRKYLPYCVGVASYASVKSIANYSAEELSILHDAGLRMLYMRFETGYDEALKNMKKNHRVVDAVEQAGKLNKAKIQYNAIVLYGIAGAGKGNENAVMTAELLNKLQVHKVIMVNLTVFPCTELEDMINKESFRPSNLRERLEEIKALLDYLNPQNNMGFDTTHPTNIIRIKGQLPEDKEKLIAQLEERLWTVEK